MAVYKTARATLGLLNRATDIHQTKYKLRKVPWSKWRNLDRPNLKNLTVQIDNGPQLRLWTVILDSLK